MRIPATVAALLSLTAVAEAQLFEPDGEFPLNSLRVERAVEVPPKLQGDATLTFVELDMVFDGGSHVAKFRRGDTRALTLFFPHPGYWSPRAKKQRIQPLAVIVRRDDRQMLVEVDHSSPLQERLVELIDGDLARDGRTEEEKETLARVRDCIRHREPLREIRDRMDPETGELSLESDPFDQPDPLE